MKKLGESTFAEVFHGTYRNKNVAVKIIPFGGTTLVNGFPQTHPDDVYQEIKITKLLSNIEKHLGSQLEPHSNFVKAHTVAICQGLYPQTLIKEWDTWAQRKVSENDRPDSFDREQLYSVFILENAGTDLEHYALKDLMQAKSVLLQVCLSLAAAEKVFHFEHRDLHWGNILVSATASDMQQYLLEDRFFSIETHGVNATIIDYTISRLDHGGLPF